jgi:hypothetical protein
MPYATTCNGANRFQSFFASAKGVVFMTFWQGLILSILITFNPPRATTEGGDDDNKDLNKDMAAMLQNILICLEMLFFSLAHFCVFPTDDWEDGYRPKEMEKPGIAIHDFVKDVGLVLDHTARGISARQRKGTTDQEAISPKE